MFAHLMIFWGSDKLEIQAIRWGNSSLSWPAQENPKEDRGFKSEGH